MSLRCDPIPNSFFMTARPSMPFRLIATTFLCTALIGCATYEYTPTAGVQPARIKLPPNPPPIVQIAPAEAPCPKANLDRSKSEIDIEPGRRLLIELGYSSAGLAFGSECVVTLSFVPMAGREYSILYQPTARGCSAGIVTRSEAGTLIREPSSQQEGFKRCLY